MRTLPDDLECNIFESNEIPDAEGIVDMPEGKVVENPSGDIECRHSAVIDIGFENVWDCIPNLILCSSASEYIAGIYIELCQAPCKAVILYKHQEI